MPFTIFSTARAQSLAFVTRRLKRDENEQPSLAYDFFRFLRRPLVDKRYLKAKETKPEETDGRESERPIVPMNQGNPPRGPR